MEKIKLTLEELKSSSKDKKELLVNIKNEYKKNIQEKRSERGGDKDDLAKR
jgi:hypothetical protein